MTGIALISPFANAGIKTFAPFHRPVDIASTPSRLLAVSERTPTVIMAFDASGKPSPFATAGTSPPRTEAETKDSFSLAVSPGLQPPSGKTPFPKRQVYLTQDRFLYEVSPDGKDVVEYEINSRTTSRDCANGTALTFDQVGTFDHALLMIDTCGKLFSKHYGEPIRRLEYSLPPGHTVSGRNDPARPQVAPLSFEPYGGHLLVPFEGISGTLRGSLYSINPRDLDSAGRFTGSLVLQQQAAIIDISFLPERLCDFTPEGAFFAASYAHVEGAMGRNEIWKFSAEDFSSAAIEGVVGRQDAARGVAIITGGYGTSAGGDSPVHLLASNGSTAYERNLPVAAPPPPRGRVNGADFAACPEPFTLTAGDLATLEGNAGPKTIEVDVALAEPLVEALEVNYATADETATAPGDYVPVSSTLGGPLRFEPGETQKRISLTIVGDVLVEPDETFLINLTKAGEPATVLAQATITISNDDDDLVPPLPTLPPPPQLPEPSGGFAGSSPGEPPPANTPPVTQQAISQAANPPGGKAPPPVPPGPASGSGPSLASLSGAEPGSVASFSAAPGSSPGLAQVPVPVPAAAPGPPALSPQFQPLAHPLAGQREEAPQAAPETDYAMVAHKEPFVMPAAALAGGAILLAFGCWLSASDGRRRRLPAWSFGTGVCSAGAEGSTPLGQPDGRPAL